MYKTTISQHQGQYGSVIKLNIVYLGFILKHKNKSKYFKRSRN